MAIYSYPTSQLEQTPVVEQVQSLLTRFTQLWYAGEGVMPPFQHTYTPAEQVRREKDLDRLTRGLIYEIQHMPADAAARVDLSERLRLNALGFVRDAFSLNDAHLTFLERSGMIEATQEFARMARRFDSAISGDDIFQASRNVMSMNFTQLLMDLPVEVTPSVFAYSMLYPYTDNYLDDPAISREVKRAFNIRFQHRLEGRTVEPANHHEEQIGELVSMIEGQYPRSRFPQVWESLQAIHAAQARSLKLVLPGASPFEGDVLGISFEKGGTSVLADGYLVAGWLSPQEAEFLFGYGCFTQLMDDLEDIEGDMREGRMTLFTQTAPYWKLDGVTSRMFHFGRAIFELAGSFRSPAARPLNDLIQAALDPILVDTLGRAGKYYSRAYLREMERHLPFRFDALKKQRARLERSKVTLARMVDGILI